jgi:hypothetical protein
MANRFCSSPCAGARTKVIQLRGGGPLSQEKVTVRSTFSGSLPLVGPKGIGHYDKFGVWQPAEESPK